MSMLMQFLLSEHKRLYRLQMFVLVDKWVLVEINKSYSVDISTYKRVNKCKTLLVPKVSTVLRIKLVEDFTGIEGFHVSFGGNEYMFSSEGKDLEGCPGVLLSYWVKSKLATTPRLSFEEAKSWIGCHGKGFGSRSEAKCVSMNVYLDERMSKRSHPTPFVAADEVHLMQYFNKNFKQHVMRASLLKPVNSLLNGAVSLAKQGHPQLMELIGDSCTKGIATSGSLQCGGTSFEIYLYAFANTIHADGNDKLRGETLEHAKSAAEGIGSDYLKRLLSCRGFGLPTTIGYQVIAKSGTDMADIDYSQYFCLSGLGLGVAIEHGITHHFIGSMFKHNTAVATIRYSNGHVSIGQKQPEFLSFAWGRSGGRKNYSKMKVEADNESEVEANEKVVEVDVPKTVV